MFDVRGYTRDPASGESVLAVGSAGAQRVVVMDVRACEKAKLPLDAIIGAIRAANRVHVGEEARPLRALLVHATATTVDAAVRARVAEACARTGAVVEYWSERELAAAAPAHVDAVPLERVTERPPNATALPRLPATDVLARWYDVRAGDVVAMTECRPHAGRVRTLRLVV